MLRLKLFLNELKEFIILPLLLFFCDSFCWQMQCFYLRMSLTVCVFIHVILILATTLKEISLSIFYTE